MSAAARPLIVANWKMNGLSSSLTQIAHLLHGLRRTRGSADIVVCPPATLLSLMACALESSPVALGGQDCHAEESGAFTGEVAAEMLSDAGARYVIVGHSERRIRRAETDAVIAAKADAAVRAGLTPIVCIGESLDVRDRGRTLDVLTAQVLASCPPCLADKRFVVAYEPCWAIGANRTPTAEQIAEAHAAIHGALARRFGSGGRAVPVLYGGSVKGENAAGIFGIAKVAGVLVGRASLDAREFLRIVEAAAPVDPRLKAQPA